MLDCIFCKIVKGELPSYRIYEDNFFIAILDVFPVSKGHTLIIPKKHYQWVYEVEPFEKYWGVANKILIAMKKALNPEWMQYFTHGIIPHAHIHIIPRYESIKEGRVIPEENLTKKPGNEEMEQMAEKIRKAL